MFIFRKVIYDGSSGAAIILFLPVLKWEEINECTVMSVLIVFVLCCGSLIVCKEHNWENHFVILAMRWAAASLSRLSETEWRIKKIRIPYYRSEMTDWSGLCLKLPSMRSAGNIAFANVNEVKKLRYHIDSGCKLFLLMYTFIILTMHLSAWRKRTEVTKGQKSVTQSIRWPS